MHMLHFHVEVNHHKTVMGFSLNGQTNETDPETNKSHILGSTFFLSFKGRGGAEDTNLCLGALLFIWDYRNDAVCSWRQTSSGNITAKILNYKVRLSEFLMIIQ